MTITSGVVRVTYAGDGASTAFAVPFPFFGSAEIQVGVTSANGSVAWQVLNGDYTVSGGSDATGLVLFKNAPPAGLTVLIFRLTNRTQLTDLQANDDMPADQLETTFDRLAALAAEDLDLIQTSLRLPIQEGPTAPLPPKGQRANTYLVFDANGNPGAVPFPSANTVAQTLNFLLGPGGVQAFFAAAAASMRQSANPLLDGLPVGSVYINNGVFSVVQP